MTIVKKIAAGIVSASLCAAVFAANQDVARPTTPEFQKSAVYQILLPVFTQEGTLAKAQEMLPHIKSAGMDVVYLCPVVESDTDTNREFWSRRQKASGTENPRNPYRMKDYFKIDPAFGTDADLKSFVEAAHKLGLKVILDLVYYHCGPNAVFIKSNPDFVVRDAEGKVKTGKWNFPELNFKNPALREYLYKNMEHFVKDFGVDGYRTDVEILIPADFWDDACARLRKTYPALIMVGESERATAQISAYDANYCWGWYRALVAVFEGKKPASELRKAWEAVNEKMPINARVLRALDNHDTASDVEGRVSYERKFGSRGMDAVQVLNFAIDGIPFVYNGNEIANDAYLSMFSSKEHGRYFVAWENALAENGKRRLALIKKLSDMRHEYSALSEGKTLWLDTSAPESVAVFVREAKGQKLLVAVNVKNSAAEAEISSEIEVGRELLSYGAKVEKTAKGLKISLSPYGYAVWEIK